MIMGCAAPPAQAPAEDRVLAIAVPAWEQAPARTAEPEPRACPPLPVLRAGASPLERRVHTQTIVRMYADCAEAPPAESSACELLSIAFDESELAPAWYVRAGPALERCGYAKAIAKAAYRACYAERRNGSARDCEALP